MLRYVLEERIHVVVGSTELVVRMDLVLAVPVVFADYRGAAFFVRRSFIVRRSTMPEYCPQSRPHSVPPIHVRISRLRAVLMNDHNLANMSFSSLVSIPKGHRSVKPRFAKHFTPDRGFSCPVHG